MASDASEASVYCEVIICCLLVALLVQIDMAL